MPLKDNISQSRFELEIEGRVVFSDYVKRGSVVSLTHVETPPAIRGRGAAGKLMQEIVEAARREGWKLHPVCSYAADWLQRHPEHGDLLG